MASKVRRAKRTIVVIEWFDSAFRSGEHRAHEIKERMEVTTVGELISTANDHYTLAGERYEDDPLDPVFRRVYTIPKVNVIRVRKFRY